VDDRPLHLPHKVEKKALKRAHKKKGNKREPVREGQYFRREELIF
jgi:hypothetical protein